MMASRMLIPSTAFSLGRGKKRPRKESVDHLKWIRTLPCIICGTHKEVEAAHIRMGSLIHGKNSTGAGEKPSDCWSLPICAEHHRTRPDAQHVIGEEQFWARHKINPFILALSLWQATGDDGAAETILRNAARVYAGRERT